MVATKTPHFTRTNIQTSPMSGHSENLNNKNEPSSQLNNVTYSEVITNKNEEQNSKLQKEITQKQSNRKLNIDKKLLKNEFKKIIDSYDIPKEDRQDLFTRAIEDEELEIPITQYIDSSNSVQSFQLKDFEPTFNNVEEMLSLMDISHLSEGSKQIFTDCCTKYFDAWAKFTWDCGRVTHTTARVEVDTNQPLNQKKSPT